MEVHPCRSEVVPLLTIHLCDTCCHQQAHTQDDVDDHCLTKVVMPSLVTRVSPSLMSMFSP